MRHTRPTRDEGLTKRHRHDRIRDPGPSAAGGDGWEPQRTAAVAIFDLWRGRPAPQAQGPRGTLRYGAKGHRGGQGELEWPPLWAAPPKSARLNRGARALRKRRAHAVGRTGNGRTLRPSAATGVEEWANIRYDAISRPHDWVAGRVLDDSATTETVVMVMATLASVVVGAAGSCRTCPWACD